MIQTRLHAASIESVDRVGKSNQCHRAAASAGITVQAAERRAQMASRRALECAHWGRGDANPPEQHLRPGSLRIRKRRPKGPRWPAPPRPTPTQPPPPAPPPPTPAPRRPSCRARRPPAAGRVAPQRAGRIRSPAAGRSPERRRGSAAGRTRGSAPRAPPPRPERRLAQFG
jgi:hypothetical protein